ncbi:MAG TPA: NADH-quinone oxidoreductase subunit C [Steroidobacteraceae bacterium]|jgi:NADH-quinone oxidoreductase subunit C|nr:NADH-quinone oxidoreductase subunit C [Steroidobacteraceae bacterium]
MSSDPSDAAVVVAPTRLQRLAGAVVAAFPERLHVVANHTGELTYEVPAARLLEVATVLRDSADLKFEMCMDVCGVDYLEHGLAEWKTEKATTSGFSRGVTRKLVTEGARLTDSSPGRRFAVVYHLLSISLNHRMRLRVFCPDDGEPMVDSVTQVWAGVDWFERETFDLFGIFFRGHPDLRRLLTDYGFIGHPFRKDFPLSGNVEVRYDPEKGRVVYQPVTIDPRVLVPKVIRHDNRYDPALTNAPVAANGKPSA